jgi:Protein-tyrosine phosphatase
MLTGDFWRCAWENDVSVIVGLAKVQKGFSGSSPYWPTGAVGAAVTFDEFTIVLVEEHEVSSDVVQRKLTLSNGSGETRSVLHLHYQSWPNYGVPATTDGLRLLLRAVEKVCHPLPLRATSAAVSLQRFLTLFVMVSAPPGAWKRREVSVSTLQWRRWQDWCVPGCLLRPARASTYFRAGWDRNHPSGCCSVWHPHRARCEDNASPTPSLDGRGGPPIHLRVQRCIRRA